jgi:hypothetical protein
VLILGSVNAELVEGQPYFDNSALGIQCPAMAPTFSWDTAWVSFLTGLAARGVRIYASVGGGPATTAAPTGWANATADTWAMAF